MMLTGNPQAPGTPGGGALRAEAIRKSYVSGDGLRIEVLRRLDLSVAEGEMVAIVGASGVGKSTLLHVLGGLDRPDEGAVWLKGRRIDDRDPAALAALRNREVGFVFQFHHLLPEFDAVENVMMPLLIGRSKAPAARGRAERALRELGLGERLSHRPSQLSGGEQQRVAIARALVNRPAVVLADEPTGNLDPATGEAVFNMFKSLQAEHGFSAVVATHNERLARRCSRILQLEDGRLVEVLWEDVHWVPGRPASGPH